MLPSPFYCSPQTFKVIFNHTNPPRLLWPLHFIVFILHQNPLLIINPYNSTHETIGPKFKDFYFWAKLCILTNLRRLFSDIYQMNYEKYSPNMLKQSIFGTKFELFCFAWFFPSSKLFLLWMKLWNFKRSRVLISNMTVVFWNCNTKKNNTNK